MPTDPNASARQAPPPPRAAFPWKGIGAILLLALVLLLAHHFPLVTALEQASARWRNDPLAPLYFLLAGTAFSAVGLPRQALCLLAGSLFGVLAGLALATATTLAGSLIGFAWARYGSRTSMTTRPLAPGGKFGARLAPFHTALVHAPFRSILILRLMPVGSALFVTVAAGVFRTPVAAFLMATLIGALPQNLVFVLMGAGARIGQFTQLALGVILFGASTALGLLLLRHIRQITPELAAAIGTASDGPKGDDTKIP